MNNSIISIINNEEDLYDGNLKYYAKIIFNGSGIFNYYHNLSHAWDVTSSVYEGAKYLAYYKEFGKRKFRALLIAALFHDFNHSGEIGNDKEEINQAINGFKQYLLKEDEDILPDVEEFIKATEFPYINNDISLGSQLMRDADMCQNFKDNWGQQAIINLAKETNLTPLEMLKKQPEFLSSVVFHTEWAKRTYGPEMIKKRLEEVEKLIDILS